MDVEEERWTGKRIAEPATRQFTREKKIKITKYEKANESVEEKIILRTIAAPIAPSSTTAIDEKNISHNSTQANPKRDVGKSISLIIHILF